MQPPPCESLARRRVDRRIEMVPVAGLARVFPDTTRRRPALAGQQRAARRRGHKRRERLSRQERLHKHAAADQAIHGLREDHATAAGEVVDEAMQVGGLGPHVELLAHKVGEVVGRLGKRQPPNAVELRARGEESCSTLPLRATPPPPCRPLHHSPVGPRAPACTSAPPEPPRESARGPPPRCPPLRGEAL